MSIYTLCDHLFSYPIPFSCSPSPAPRPVSCSPARSRSPVPRPPHRNSGGVFNMMSGWTGCAYQTAWTLDFASERSDAKSHVRNRQDGPDIMHLKRTQNVRLGNIAEQSPFRSWTDGLAIKTPNRSPEFDTICASAGSLPRLAS